MRTPFTPTGGGSGGPFGGGGVIKSPPPPPPLEDPLPQKRDHKKNPITPIRGGGSFLWGGSHYLLGGSSIYWGGILQSHPTPPMTPPQKGTRRRKTGDPITPIIRGGLGGSSSWGGRSFIYLGGRGGSLNPSPPPDPNKDPPPQSNVYSTTIKKNLGGTPGAIYGGGIPGVLFLFFFGGGVFFWGGSLTQMRSATLSGISSMAVL